MAPKHKLEEILRTLTPTAHEGRWVFVSVPRTLPLDVVPVASIREREGLSVVIAQDDADRHGLPYDFVAGWIECSVETALTAVGVTAAIAAALAGAAIPANVIAGVHHDHLFVPIAQREDALAVLDELGDVRRPERPSGPRAARTDGVPEIEIRDGEIRLGQFLKLAGLVDSGAAAKPVLAYGRVKVNGDLESRRGRQLVVGDVVSVDGRSVAVG